MSLYPVEHTAELKAWLNSELEPICDADPDVLADYVLALLKHPGSEAELRTMLSDQLSDFLGDQTRVFVENVFTGLQAKIYLPQSSAPAASAPAPTVATAEPEGAKPTSATAAVGTKRRADDDAEQAIPTGPKAQRTAFGSSAPAASSLPANPALQGMGMPMGPGPRNMMIGHGNGMQMGVMRMGPSMGQQPHHQQAQQQPQPHQQQSGAGGRQQGELCRDYHTKGFCARGSNCKFLHSSDIITGGMSMNGFPTMPGAPFGAPGQGSAPAPGMVGQGPGAMGFPPNGMGPGFQNRGPLPGPPGAPMGPGRSDGPSLASRLSMAQSQPPMMSPSSQGGTPPIQPAGSPGFGLPGFAMPNPMMMMQQQQQRQHQQQQQHQQHQAQNGGMGGGMQGGRGGFRGGRGGGQRQGAGRFGNVRRSDTTLVVENIPPEHLDLVKINDFFKQFGTLTNIQIDASQKKALLSYSSPEEAKTAHSNPEPIFGNRFIKVYFMRLDDESGNGGAGGNKGGGGSGPAAGHQRPPPTQIFRGDRSNVYVAPLSPTSQAETAARNAAIAERKRLSEEQSAAQYALDLLRGESKTVISKVSAPNASEEVKSEGMKRFMELEKEIKEGTERVRKAIAALEAAPKIPPAPAAAAGGGGAVVDAAKREEMERKRLDRELELHTKSADGQETPEELRAKLAKLQEEAASIGLDANGQPIGGSGSSFRGGPRGGFRGSFRARGAFRGRGGRGGGSSSVSFFNLDNRTTKVLVAPGEGEAWDADKTERAKQWAKSFGEVNALDDDASGFVATFKTRAHAEQALRSGGSIPNVGSAKLSWVNSPAAGSNGGGGAADGAGAETNGGGSEDVKAEGDGAEDDDLALYES